MFKKVPLIAIGAILLGSLILLGAGCKLPFTRSPEDILEDMRSNMVRVNSLHYEFNVNISGEGAGLSGDLGAVPANAESSMSMQTFGDINFKDYVNTESSSNSQISIESQGVALSLDLDSVKIAGDSYVKFSKLPGFGGFNTDKILGQWYQFDPRELQQGLPALPTGVEEKVSVTPEQTEQIKELVRKTQFFTVKDDMGKEDLNGINSYHYSVVLNKEAVKNFTIEFRRIIGQPMTVSEMQEMEDGLNNLSVLEGEIWIGAKDKLIRRIKTSDFQFTDPESQAKTTANLSLTLSNFNKAVSISAPANFKPGSALMSDLLGGSIMLPETGGQTQSNGVFTPGLPEGSQDLGELPEDFELPDTEELQKSLEGLQEQFKDLESQFNY